MCVCVCVYVCVCVCVCVCTCTCIQTAEFLISAYRSGSFHKVSVAGDTGVAAAIVVS